MNNAKNEEADRKQQQLLKVRRWISAPTSLQSQLHSNFEETRKKYPGTTKWILDNVKVQNWVDDEIPEQPILWINAKKGAGESAP